MIEHVWYFDDLDDFWVLSLADHKTLSAMSKRFSICCTYLGVL